MPAFTTTIRKLFGSAKPTHTQLPPSSSYENVFQQWSLVNVPGNVQITHIHWPADKGLAFPAVLQTLDPEAVIEDELTAYTNAFDARVAVPAICVTEPEDDAELCALINEVCSITLLHSLYFLLTQLPPSDPYPIKQHACPPR